MNSEPRKKAYQVKKSQKLSSGLKVLAWDIETAPATCYSFSLWKPVIGIEQIIEPSRILCWSAAWANHPTSNRKVMFQSEWAVGRQQMLQELHDLLTEADVVLTYNGKKFDMPWVKGEFISEGLPPIPPVQHIDLYQVARTNARFLSNKLDYVSSKLLGERKVAHQGFGLWKGCMNGDPKAQKTMERYAKQDTALLPKLWDVLRPYTTGANAIHAGRPSGCPSCGGGHYQSRGYYQTKVSQYQRFQCQNCGHWFRDKTRREVNETRDLP